MAEIDRRCFCGECERRTRDTYRLPARCSNCGAEHTLLMRKGDKPGYGHTIACPDCGVSDITISHTMIRADSEGLGT